ELNGQYCTLIRQEVGLTIEFSSGTAELVHDWYFGFEHQRELERGLEGYEDRCCPVKISAELTVHRPIELVFSLSREEGSEFLADQRAAPKSKVGQQLAEACQIFLTRSGDRTSILAGYPWFSDWGRDTMISLPGALICTGNLADAQRILLDYAGWMRNGLIPNRFTEAGKGADYNSVDSTLWFINAVWKCLQATWDDEFAQLIAPAISSAIDSYCRGTDFGIRMDKGGLLTQGGEGLQLTWMDAKIGDWVVTPRGGKAVEINALWINALACASEVLKRTGKDCSAWREIERLASESFESRFWNEEAGCYFDVIDPEDNAVRPNQILGMALPFTPMVGDRAIRALDTVTQILYTSNGLRTLDPKNPAYRGRFTGSMPERDAAYHQGTAWPWLLGSYASALIRLKGERAAARSVIVTAMQSMDVYGIGGIAEVFDGDLPQNAGGCPWQAWSVAELLRAWEEDHLDEGF
ncbi:MAG TPA: amylo-alpha-1,6-glucosidase, partial [Fimbriimonadaceae bacterium]|nr:amylo-alpha-1,6-glucosidase [Fimbriimonadaceae bacterium]